MQAHSHSVPSYAPGCGFKEDFKCTPSVIAMAVLSAALDLLSNSRMSQIREKSVPMTHSISLINNHNLLSETLDGFAGDCEIEGRNTRHRHPAGCYAVVSGH